jgi:hypothetical protein
MSDIMDPSTTSSAESPTGGLVEAFVFSEVFGSEDLKKAFTTYLQAEMTDASGNASRTDYLDNLKKLDKQIQARPQTEKKNYPYEGAANLCPPLTFKKGNTIYSKVLSNYSTKRPFWSIETADSTMAPAADALAAYMNFLSKSAFHLNLKKVNRRMFWQVVFKGTQFYEVAWDMKQAPVVQNGEQTSEFKYAKNTPVINLVRTEDFLTRTDWADIQDMPWLGIKVRYSWAELQSMFKLGQIAIENKQAAPGEVINLADLALTSSKFTDMEENERELMRLSGDIDSAFPEGQYFDLYKFWAFYDPKGDGNVVDLQGIMDLNTGTLLRCEVNKISHRLVGKVVYYEVPGMLYGLGIAHILEYLQDEIEGLHNSRMDAISWAMLQLWLTQSGSKAALKKAWKPGEHIIVDNMNEIHQLVTPDLSQAAYPAEEIVERYADQATGANEAMAGRADPTLKSGGGAEAQMILMQTGSSVLNTTLDTIDEYYAEIGPMIVLLLQQNAALLDPANYIKAEEAELVQKIFALSPELVPSLLKFSIETTDLARNEGSRKQDFLGFSALYAQYIQEFTETYAAFVSSAGNPLLQTFYLRALTGKASMMEKMVEFFHVGNPEDYIVTSKVITQLLGGQNAESGNGTGLPTESGGPGPGQGQAGGLGGPLGSTGSPTVLPGPSGGSAPAGLSSAGAM